MQNVLLMRKDSYELRMRKMAEEFLENGLSRHAAKIKGIYSTKMGSYLRMQTKALLKLDLKKLIPGYLNRLRASNSSLTEAEERLFLFIKLNLKE